MRMATHWRRRQPAGISTGAAKPPAANGKKDWPAILRQAGGAPLCITQTAAMAYLAGRWYRIWVDECR